MVASVSRVTDTFSPTKSKLGRPRGGDTEKTRSGILDASEGLFAEHGYEGTSIRDISRVSGVSLAVISYHFGPKEQLFDSVISRRAGILNDARREQLEAIESSDANAEAQIAMLVRGYCGPFIEYALTGNEGWRNYAALMGRLANSRRGTDMVARYFDEIAQDYIMKLTELVGKRNGQAVIEGFLGVVANMLFICASTGRSEKLVKNLDLTGAGIDLIERFVSFSTAGFVGLMNESKGDKK